MQRLFLTAPALLFLVPPAAAQPQIAPKDGKVVYFLNVSPEVPRKPLSRDYLLPEYGESLQGNKVQMFLRCFMEQDNFFGREESERRQKWNEMKLEDLPKEELKDYGNRLLDRDMYDASRMTQVDWQLWHFIRRDGYNTLLPDVQKFRALAETLKTRARGQIANRNFDGAIKTIKTMFGLASTMQQHPTLIGSLVGIAIANIAINLYDEFADQPGAPNLYWSFTDLPSPLFDLRLAVQGERMFLTYQFDFLVNAKGALPDVLVYKAMTEVDEMINAQAGMPAQGKGALRPVNDPATTKYKKWAADPKRVELARNRLVEYGYKPEVVKEMTAIQATVTDDLRRYEVIRDELFKWVALPLTISEQRLGEEEQELLQKNREDMVLAPLLIAAVKKVKNAQVRTEQRIAYCRIIEAIRVYAHANGGKLPEKLEQLTLPVPNDPYTAKPFEYSVKDGVATLHGMNPMPGSEVLNRYYEIRIRK